MNSIYRSQTGNAFMMVLIGVILFGALVFSFTRSARQGMSNISEREAKIAAQDLVSFFNQVDKAYQTLRTKNKCSADDISFSNSGDTGGFVTINDSATAPGDKSCHVFDPNGGQVTFNMDWTQFQIPYDDIPGGNQAQHGNIYFDEATTSVVNVGTAANERVIALNYVDPSVCKAYNAVLGLNIDYTVNEPGSPIGDNNTGYAGKSSFCLYFEGATNGWLRHVLLAQ